VSRFQKAILATSAVLLVGLGLIVAGIYSDQIFGKVATGLQAIGVVVALSVAAATLLTDSKDRRLDRVLDLHKELTSGEAHQARARVVDHLRSLGSNGKARPVSHRAFIDDQAVANYSSTLERKPRLDLNIIIRFFERANSARLAEAVHLQTFAILVGGHALWWDRAIIEQPTEFGAITHLRQLASWTRVYASHRLVDDPNMTRWLAHVDSDFADVGP
jgi:hypothetical protein